MSLLRPSTNNNKNNNAKKKQKVNNTSNNNDNDTDDTDDTSLFLDLHDHIRITILNYLGETQDELITLTLVSKQVYEDCKQSGIKWKIIPTIEIRPRQQQGGSTLALLQQLRNHHNLMDNENIRRYHHMKVNDVHKFDDPTNFYLEIDPAKDEINDLTKDFQMDSILSLDLSLSMPAIDVQHMPIVVALSEILPNLREINLSNICTNHTHTLRTFPHHCPHLEKLTWNNIIKTTFSFPLDGGYMSPAKNLKEIIMDDSEFDVDNEWKDDMSIIENTRDDTFIFYRCSKALERVSIRNMKWDSEVAPQDALIKFVRNVPTLRWFRSDLTIENMKMLHLERPEIVLQN